MSISVNMQLGTNFALIASISFLIIFSFVRFLQRVPFHTGNGQTETIDYYNSTRLQEVVVASTSELGGYSGKKDDSTFPFLQRNL